MKRILIVEDDININNMLKEALEKENFLCEQAFSGSEARLLVKMIEKSYDLILLDLMLPGISGEEVLTDIREKGNLPVIVLTAKDTLDEKIELLTNGADDYITKPFEIREVIARIQVQLRHSSKEQEKNILIHKNMKLQRDKFLITVEGKEVSQITKQEFAILELLMKYPKKVFSKEDIFEYAWNEQYMGETKTLDVHISNIRKKLKAITPEDYIETIWGIGYRLCP